MRVNLSFSVENTVGINKINDAAVGGAYITHEEIERR